MKRACAIASYIREFAGSCIKVGRTTDEIDKMVHAEVLRLGVYPSPLGYDFADWCVCATTCARYYVCELIALQCEFKLLAATRASQRACARRSTTWCATASPTTARSRTATSSTSTSASLSTGTESPVLHMCGRCCPLHVSFPAHELFSSFLFVLCTNANALSAPACVSRAPAGTTATARRPFTWATLTRPAARSSSSRATPSARPSAFVARACRSTASVRRCVARLCTERGCDEAWRAGERASEAARDAEGCWTHSCPLRCDAF